MEVPESIQAMTTTTPEEDLDIDVTSHGIEAAETEVEEVIERLEVESVDEEEDEDEEETEGVGAEVLETKNIVAENVTQNHVVVDGVEEVQEMLIEDMGAAERVEEEVREEVVEEEIVERFSPDEEVVEGWKSQADFEKAAARGISGQGRDNDEEEEIEDEDYVLRGDLKGALLQSEYVWKDAAETEEVPEEVPEGPTPYGTKPGHFETSKIHFPMSEGVSEVSGASERLSVAEGASEASSPEQANE